MYIEQKYKNWAQDIKHSKNIAGSIIYLIIYLVKKKTLNLLNKQNRIKDPVYLISRRRLVNFLAPILFKR